MPVEVTEFLSNVSPRAAVKVFEAITVLGEQYVVIAFIALFYWCIDKEKGRFIALCSVTSLGFNNFFKNVFKVPRPFDVSDKVNVTRRETATGYSFPSGHTQNASTAAFSAAHGSKKAAPYAAAAIYVILVGLSRLVLGVHYVTDVLGALLLSFVSIAAVSAVCRLCEKRGERCMALLFIPALLSLCSVFIPGAQAKDALTSGGIAVGAVAGIMLEKKYIGFTVKGSALARALRFFCGFAVIIALMLFMKMILPDYAALRVIRYFIIGITATAGMPFVFKKINL